jgi:hypothetical protein
MARAYSSAAWPCCLRMYLGTWGGLWRGGVVGGASRHSGSSSGPTNTATPQQHSPGTGTASGSSEQALRARAHREHARPVQLGHQHVHEAGERGAHANRHRGQREGEGLQLGQLRVALRQQLAGQHQAAVQLRGGRGRRLQERAQVAHLGADLRGQAGRQARGRRWLRGGSPPGAQCRAAGRPGGGGLPSAPASRFRRSAARTW